MVTSGRSAGADFIHVVAQTSNAMKVAIAVHEFPTLSETFVLNIIVGLLERGHEVHIFAEKRGNPSVQHPLVGAHRLLERTTYLARMPGPRATRLRSALSLLNR